MTHRLPVDMIRPGQSQARRSFAEDALDELAASIAESGVIQPVVVRGDRATGYQLLAGERRWRAAQRAGLDYLPAIVRNDLDEAQASVLGLIENLQRESLGLIETAHGLAQLGEVHQLTHEAIAQKIGKSRAYVTNFLRLRQLESTVQTLLDVGQLSLGHAKVLAGFSGAHQVTLARRAATQRLSVRQLERIAQRVAETPRAAAAAGSEDAALSVLEQRLSEHVGNTVQIQYSADRRRGELRIAFHDLDEFDGLLARLGYTEE